MQDIVEKFDRAKELLALSRTDMDRDQEDAVAAELLGLGIDAIGELIANSRRIAVALETIAENTKPVELTVATAELVSGPSLSDQVLAIGWEGIAYRAGQAFANGQRGG